MPAAARHLLRRAVAHAALLALGCTRAQPGAPSGVDAERGDGGGAEPPADAVDASAAAGRSPSAPDAVDADAAGSHALTPEVIAKLKTRHRAMCRCIASSVDPVAPGQGPYGVIDLHLVVPADGGAPAVTMDRATVEYPPGARWCLKAIVGAMRFGPQASDLDGPHRLVFDGHECEPREAAKGCAGAVSRREPGVARGSPPAHARPGHDGVQPREST